VVKASDNDYPSILLTEQGSAPTSPAASHQRMYIRTSDHTLVTVNSSGTVAAVGAGGGGAMTRLDEKIASGGATASFDFTSISAAYRDLEIRFMLRGLGAANEVSLQLRFNADSGSNYSTQRHFATDTAVSQDSFNAQTAMVGLVACPGSTGTTGKAAAGVMLVPRYAGTTFHKMLSVRATGWSSNSSTTFARAVSNVGQWASTAAINQVTLSFSSGNIADGSVATLYGIN
jgi:hypothetical protein